MSMLLYSAGWGFVASITEIREWGMPRARHGCSAGATKTNRRLRINSETASLGCLHEQPGEVFSVLKKWVWRERASPSAALYCYQIADAFRKRPMTEYDSHR